MRPLGQRKVENEDFAYWGWSQLRQATSTLVRNIASMLPPPALGCASHLVFGWYPISNNISNCYVPTQKWTEPYWMARPILPPKSAWVSGNSSVCYGSPMNLVTMEMFHCSVQVPDQKLISHYLDTDSSMVTLEWLILDTCKRWIALALSCLVYHRNR
jgi:hypothetical protein